MKEGGNSDVKGTNEHRGFEVSERTKLTRLSQNLDSFNKVEIICCLAFAS